MLVQDNRSGSSRRCRIKHHNSASPSIDSLIRFGVSASKQRPQVSDSPHSSSSKLVRRAQIYLGAS